MTFDFLSWFL